MIVAPVPPRSTEADAPSPLLDQLGWGPFFARPFEALLEEEPELEPARVCIEHNHLYRVMTAASGDSGLLAQVAGRVKHAAPGQSALPGVGDWVAVRTNPDGPATIRVVLPRRTYFSRKAAGQVTTEQIVAANIDTVFLVAGLDDDFNPKRIERYLVATADSGARAVVVLNKADLVPDARAAVDTLREQSPDTPVHLVSCVEDRGLEPLRQYVAPGQTVALLGSSGVGKSTIINHLLGSDRQRTRAVRSRDRRGRHTTVHRELLLLPHGGVIIDTPGMRELRLWDRHRAVQASFDDIEQLAAECRFRDCEHRTEPGCAVREAVRDGRIPTGRLTHYHQLRTEQTELETRRQQALETRERQPTRRGARSSRRLSNRH